jgi:hypothetical protein
LVSLAETVVAFLNSNRGAGYCDSCLAQKFSVEAVSEVSAITDTLELFPDFLRTVGQCHVCGRTSNPVTQAV